MRGLSCLVWYPLLLLLPFEAVPLFGVCVIFQPNILGGAIKILRYGELSACAWWSVCQSWKSWEQYPAETGAWVPLYVIPLPWVFQEFNRRPLLRVPRMFGKKQAPVDVHELCEDTVWKQRYRKAGHDQKNAVWLPDTQIIACFAPHSVRTGRLRWLLIPYYRRTDHLEILSTAIKYSNVG